MPALSNKGLLLARDSQNPCKESCETPTPAAQDKTFLEQG